jgi:hypothetical protein
MCAAKRDFVVVATTSLGFQGALHACTGAFLQSHRSLLLLSANHLDLITERLELANSEQT